MIIGTAGHINHGKSTLVRALTGMDVDRLKEEKKRGISIELGYAHINCSDGRIISFIDVPGHEKFIKTMLSGIFGINFALLLIAADDGIMPQTREHLSILSLLGIASGSVVITKVDRVSKTRLNSLNEEILDFVSGTLFENALIFKINTLCETDSDLLYLRRYLIKNSINFPYEIKSNFFRLPIDRVFTLPGRGTIVTGTIYDGQIQIDNSKNMNLSIMPHNKKVRIRGIHAGNRHARIVYSGQRCALNLIDVEKKLITRGDWISDRRCFIPSFVIDVNFHLLSSITEILKNWSLIHIHLGTGRYLARLVLLENISIFNPGETTKAQLIFEQPVCSMVGDRFIVRNAQANCTIGGGLVLDPNASIRKRRSLKRKKWLNATQQFLEKNDISSILEESPFGISEEFLNRIIKGATFEDLSLTSSFFWLETKNDHLKILILAKYWNLLCEAVVYNLSKFHESNPNEPGINRLELRNIVSPSIPKMLWKKVLSELLLKKQIIANGSWLCIPEHNQLKLNAKEVYLANRCVSFILKNSKPSWIRDIASKLCEKETDLRKLFKKLVQKGELVQIFPDLFYHERQVNKFTQLIYSLSMEYKEGISPAIFRDAANISRKLAIQILEYFNKIGYTERIKVDGNHIVKKSILFKKNLQKNLNFDS